MKSCVTGSYTQFMEELLKKDNLKCNFIKKYQQKDNIFILCKRTHRVSN